MLTPEKIDKYSYNRVVDLYYKLNVDISADIIERVSALGNITQTTEDELKVLLELNGDEVFKETLMKVSALDDATKTELAKLYRDVAKENMKGYKPLYEYQDKKFELTKKQMRILNKGITKNNKEIRNFTTSTAYNSKELFIDSVDEAYLKVVSGAMSYDKAIEQSYKEIASTGLKMTDKAGRKTSIDVAVRRAVLTGIQHTANAINYDIGKYLGCDGYEVSAHWGARPTHEEAQGKQYAIEEETAKEYGIGVWEDVEYLWEEPNCRHTVYPIIVGISEPTYTQQELNEYNNATTTLYGEEVPIYEATQEMRKIEREIRNTKREVEVLKTAGVDYNKEQLKLRELQKQYTKVSNETDIPQSYDRIKTYSRILGSSSNTNYNEKINIKLSNEEFNKINISNDDLIYKAYSKQTLSKIQKYESSLKILPVEKGAILDRHGNVIAEFTGKESEVIVPTRYERELKGNIFTHTHFYDLNFSPNDLIGLVRDDEYEIRANTKNKIVYSLRKGESKIDKIGFIKKYEKDDPCSDEKIDKRMARILKNANTDYYSVDDFQNLRDNVYNELMDSWLKKNAKEYGYVYSKEEIK